MIPCGILDRTGKYVDDTCASESENSFQTTDTEVLWF